MKLALLFLAPAVFFWGLHWGLCRWERVRARRRLVARLRAEYEDYYVGARGTK